MDADRLENRSMKTTASILTVLAMLLSARAAEPPAKPEVPEEPSSATFALHPIGRVEVGDDQTAVVIDTKFAGGLLQLDRYSHVWVIWWFDRNDNAEDRSVLRVRPRGNRDNPRTGVFACRSPFRPNLVALSLCRIRAIDGNRVVVEGLDAFDGTPVIDLKPYVPPIDAPAEGEEVRQAGWRARGKDDE